MSVNYYGAVCVVPGCDYRKKVDGIQRSVHRIPKKPLYRLKWIDNIKCAQLRNIPDEVISRKGLFVCPRHFKEDCYLPKKSNGARILKVEAVPTEFLPQNDNGNMQDNIINVVDVGMSPSATIIRRTQYSPSSGKVTPSKSCCGINDIRESSIRVQHPVDISLKPELKRRRLFG